MRKILLLLGMASTFAFTGCSIDDEADVITNNYTYVGEAVEISNVDFTTGNQFTITHAFENPLIESDVLLVYRLSEVSTNTTDVWESIPRTIPLVGGGFVSYDFNFTRQDVEIYMDGNDLAQTPGFTQDQVFRIVKVPAHNPDLDRLNLSDYNAVAQRYNIIESNIKKVTK